MSENLADTLTDEGSVRRAIWATYFENQLLYLLEISALTGLLAEGWNI